MVFRLTKSRRTFYAQIERGSFRTASGTFAHTPRRQRTAAERRFPDLPRPCPGTERFDAEQSLLTTAIRALAPIPDRPAPAQFEDAGQLRWHDFALGRQNHEQDSRQPDRRYRDHGRLHSAPSAEPPAAYPVGLGFRFTSSTVGLSVSEASRRDLKQYA